MWRSVRYNNHIAFRERARLAALHVRAANFVRTGCLAADHRAPGDERGRTFEHVDDVCVFDVNLDLPGLFAAARMHLIAAVVEQDCAFGKGSLDLVCRDVGDFRASTGIARPTPNAATIATVATMNERMISYLIAAAATLASSSSCCALAAPLTPTAPTI